MYVVGCGVCPCKCVVAQGKLTRAAGTVLCRRKARAQVLIYCFRDVATKHQTSIRLYNYIRDDWMTLGIFVKFSQGQDLPRRRHCPVLSQGVSPLPALQFARHRGFRRTVCTVPAVSVPARFAIMAAAASSTSVISPAASRPSLEASPPEAPPTSPDANDLPTPQHSLRSPAGAPRDLGLARKLPFEGACGTRSHGLHRNALQRSAVLCRALQCSAVLCSASAQSMLSD